jgi:hypothetical protein
MPTRFSFNIVSAKNGAPGEIRTPDHQVRSLVLYPAELRAHGLLDCGNLTRKAKDAEARSGIIQVLVSAVNTLCEDF